MAATKAAKNPQPTRDLRRLRRRATAFCLVGGPAAMLSVSVLIPSESDSAQPYYQAFLAHPGQAQAEMGAAIVAFLLLPFLALGLYRLSARRAPVLAGIGGVLSLLGWAAVSVNIVTDALMYDLASHQTGPRIWDLLSNHDLFVNVLLLIFVVGHVVGTALLAFALRRSRAVPAWVAGTLLLSAVGHFISHLMQSRPLDVTSFGLFLVAGAAAARTVLRTADDSWDLPPLPAETNAGTRQDPRARAAAGTIG